MNKIKIVLNIKNNDYQTTGNNALVHFTLGKFIIQLFKNLIYKFE